MSQLVTNLLKYKGYLGSIEFSKEDNILFGRVLGLKSTYMSFEGNSLDELEKDFHESIDFYLDCCEADGKKTLITDIKLVQSQIISYSQQLSKCVANLSNDDNDLVIRD